MLVHTNAYDHWSVKISIDLVLHKNTNIEKLPH